MIEEINERLNGITEVANRHDSEIQHLREVIAYAHKVQILELENRILRAQLGLAAAPSKDMREEEGVRPD